MAVKHVESLVETLFGPGVEFERVPPPTPRMVEVREQDDGLIVSNECASFFVAPGDQDAVDRLNAMFRSEWSNLPIRGSC